MSYEVSRPVQTIAPRNKCGRCDCEQHSRPPTACAWEGEYRKSGSVSYVNCTEKKGFKAIWTHAYTNPRSGHHRTNAQSTSATLLSRRLNPKRRKCLRHFAKGKSINLITSKVSFTNSKYIKAIQIYKRNDVKIVF